MEFRQCRYFVAVCDAGSLLAASRLLHVAQPALGQQIAALEHEFGQQLFTRSNRGMVLTPAGEVFLGHARQLLADAERARQALTQAQETPQGKVTLGLPTTVGLIAALPILKACREQLPQVQVQIIEAYSGYLREWLMQGRLDVAMLFGESSDAAIATRLLLQDRLALIMPAEQAQALQAIGLRRVSAYPLVLPAKEHGLRKIIDDACTAAQIKLNVVAELDALPTMKRAVEAGIGMTILPAGAIHDEAARGSLGAVPIRSADMSRRVNIARNVTRVETPAVSAVHRVIIDVVHTLVKSQSWPGKWLDAGR